MATTQVLNSLSVSDLCYSYGGGSAVIRDLSFDLAQGETLAIIGSSGSGKTTLLRLLNLLLSPSSGQLALLGQDYFKDGLELYELTEIRSKIGLVFQHYNLFPNMTALRNLTIGQTHVLGRRKEEAERRSIEFAEHLGLRNLLARYPDELSGGEQQRFALVRTLLLQPAVLLLDEITSALDPLSAASVMELLATARSLPQFERMSVVMVTHAIRYAITHADRIAFLSEGRFLEVHPAKSLLREARNGQLINYLSSAGFNEIAS